MMRVTNRKKIAVIGGGITGLTAAFYLEKCARDHHLPLDVVLIESSLRLGGKIQTLRKDGFIIERGPESFIDHENSMAELAKHLGIEEAVVNNKKGQTYVAVGGHLYPIPNGILFGGSPIVPSLLTTGIVSLSGKFRAAGDLVLPKTREDKDEPIGDFFRRRFGKEVVENLVEPLLAGTFAGDIDRLSIQSMFPEIYELEKQYRSLIYGMKKTHFSFLSNQMKGYQTFKNGLETLVEKLEEQLPSKTVLKGVKVESIDKLQDGTFQIYFNNISPIKCHAVIVTTSLNEAKNMFNHYGIFDEIQDMNYATIATVTMAFEKVNCQNYDDAISFYFARNNDISITTCTWSNHKWENVAPEGYDLLRTYIGRVGDEAIVELSDADIEKTVLHDLEKSLGINQKPVFTIVSRWKQSMPQYTVGHENRLEKMREILKKDFPHVKLAGSSYEGISVPDCVLQGRQAAEEITAELFQEQLV
nr:protoporphyrinogen oxidase [Bacilli bacterium]